MPKEVVWPFAHQKQVVGSETQRLGEVKVVYDSNGAPKGTRRGQTRAIKLGGQYREGSSAET